MPPHPVLYIKGKTSKTYLRPLKQSYKSPHCGLPDEEFYHMTQYLCMFKQATWLQVYNIVKQPNRMISQLALVVFICDRPERITRQHALRQQRLSNDTSGQC
jgi:hypothetical protein